MMVKICPICNTYNNAGAKFCIKCKGYILEEPAIEETNDSVIGVENIEYIIRCPKCGNENDCGTELCVKCGTWLPRIYEPKYKNSNFELRLRTQRGECMIICSDKTYIGRDYQSYMFGADKYVNPIHFSVTYSNGTFYVSDFGSCNGTFVNGVKIDKRTPVPIKSGDSITVGRTRLTVDTGRRIIKLQ